MKKFIFVTYALCFLGLTYNGSAWSMEQNSLTLKSKKEPKISKKSNNNPNSFDVLSPDILPYLFSHCGGNFPTKKRFVDPTVATMLVLHQTCERFKQALTPDLIRAIFAQQYSDEEKTALLGKVINAREERMQIIDFASGKRKMINDPFRSICDQYYESKRQFIVPLLISGAELKNDSSKGKFIRSAMAYDDIPLIECLCDIKKIDLYEEDARKIPYFFNAQTPEMTQLCKHKGGVNILTHTLGNTDCPTVLWKSVIDSKIPSEMVDLYIRKDLSMEPRSIDGASPLHALASSSKNVVDIDDFVEKGKVLLAHRPGHLNAFDHHGKTPLDCAQENLITFGGKFNKPTKRLIAFLEENGGVSSKKLSEEPNENNQDKCVIC